MSFNPGSALTPSHDDPLEDRVLIPPHRDGTRSGRVDIGTGTAASNRAVFGSLLEPRRGNIEIHVEDSRLDERRSVRLPSRTGRGMPGGVRRR